jgi:hypothetical protein
MANTSQKVAVKLYLGPNSFNNLTKSHRFSSKVWIIVFKTIYYKSLEPELQRNAKNWNKRSFKCGMPIYFLFGRVTSSHIGWLIMVVRYLTPSKVYDIMIRRRDRVEGQKKLNSAATQYPNSALRQSPTQWNSALIISWYKYIGFQDSCYCYIEAIVTCIDEKIGRIRK